MESRAHKDSTYRRRVCGHCFHAFVTQETTSELKAPLRAPRLRKRLPKKVHITSDGSHLSKVWKAGVPDGTNP